MLLKYNIVKLNGVKSKGASTNSTGTGRLAMVQIFSEAERDAKESAVVDEGQPLLGFTNMGTLTFKSTQRKRTGP